MSRMYSVMTGTDARPVVQGLPPEVELLAEPESPPEAEAESVPFIEIGGPAGPVFSAALAPPPPKAPEVKIKSEALREFPRIVAPAPAAVTTPAPSAEAPAAPVLSVRFHDVLQRHAPRGAEGPDPGLVALHYPDHPVSGEYRILRDEVARQLPDATSRVLSFTAAAAEAGTTTVVLNLAVTLARGDQRVLVMDANFNRPGVAAKLALHPSPGLAEVLGGHLPLPWALQPTAAPGLQALACGASPDADHERLGEAVGRDLPKLLGQLRQWFDWVLIDAGVWGVAPDRDATCDAADAVYLVTRESDAARPEFTGLRAWVKQLGGSLRGYVTTRA